MDKQSVAAGFVVMLVLLGSSMSAEICEKTGLRLVICTKSNCQRFCHLEAEATHRKLEQYWCGGTVFNACYCKVCTIL
ncbi:uncharacterized protein [Triticum aestivum]|nr:uncharacterized protein LOC120963775 [Aegilops tauschii subsp. strangulata]XP_044400697.1 uncharacterized protein LOC123124056 [Triticum aestivum]